MNSVNSCLVWLRRDLRCHDHAALSRALSQAQHIWCCFVFDTDILSSLHHHDMRVTFIHQSLAKLNQQLKQLALEANNPDAELIRICFAYGKAEHEIPKLAQSLGAQKVIVSHDDEWRSLQRDKQVQHALEQIGIAWQSVKDHVIFERQEVLTQGSKPYSVFTPYKKAWLQQLALNQAVIHEHSTQGLGGALAPVPSYLNCGLPTLPEMGFSDALPDHPILHPGTVAGLTAWSDFTSRIDCYDQTRDFPAVKGPSYLSVHLRFGTVSIRELARLAVSRMQKGSTGAEIWLSELIWRDFYHQILHHHPRLCEGKSFKPEYDQIQWETGAAADADFQAWCLGQTGYPLVDAAMRQLNQTGYMHNRLRMVVASFLIKDLGIDWRWGEAYFAEKLLDFDFAANNGGWQWASSSGCDAQPYFRIFNPISQSEKFDAEGKFIRRYLPELAALDNKSIHAPWMSKGTKPSNYPGPLVDHAQARIKTLERYAVVKMKG